MFGIDVSHHQSPAAQPWEKYAAGASFCICRTTYGTMRDRQVGEHMRRARAVGLQVGVYHFYRPTQPVPDQLAAFRAAASAAKYSPGDIIPALDVERDPLPKPGIDVGPKWQEGVLAMLEAMIADFGDAMVYITQREFGMLGKPAWLLERPIWVAHYTGAAKPATPGNKAPLIWQHRVGPFDPNGPGGYDKANPLLDQNRAVGPLPLASRVPWQLVPHDPRSEPPAPPELEDDDGPSWAELRARAVELHIDDIGIIRREGLRELAGQDPEEGVDDVS
jgi:lysozyme